jgi:hypothetical protein
MSCSYCQTELTEGPTSNLQCGHIVHTRCLLVDCHAHKTFDYVVFCQTCEQTWMDDLFYQDTYRRIDEIELRRQQNVEKRDQSMNTTLQTNDSFQIDINKLQTLMKECSARRSKLKKLFKHDKQSFTKLAECSIKYLQMLSNQMIHSFEESDEYKTYISIQRRKEYMIRCILEKYDILDRDLSDRVPLQMDWKQSLKKSIQNAFKPKL